MTGLPKLMIFFLLPFFPDDIYPFEGEGGVFTSTQHSHTHLLTSYHVSNDEALKSPDLSYIFIYLGADDFLEIWRAPAYFVSMCTRYPYFGTRKRLAKGAVWDDGVERKSFTPRVHRCGRDTRREEEVVVFL